MKHLLWIILIISVQSAGSQTIITFEEAKAFMEDFLLTFQFERRANAKERIAVFFDQESRDLFLEDDYQLNFYPAFKILKFNLPEIEVLATNNVRHQWDIHLTFKLDKRNDQLFLLCKKESNDRLTPWQSSKAITPTFYSLSDIEQLEASLKEYLDENFIINAPKYNRSQFSGRWYKYTRTGFTQGYEFFDNGKFFGRKLGIFPPDNVVSPDLGRWSIYGDYLLMLERMEKNYQYYFIEKVEQDSFTLYSTALDDTLRVHFGRKDSGSSDQGKDFHSIYNPSKSSLTLLVPPTYNNIRSFTPNLLLVQHKGEEGLMDLRGQFIVPLKYDYIIPSGDSIVARMVDKWYTIDDKGQATLNPDFSKNALSSISYSSFILSEIGPLPGDRAGLINERGDTIIPFIYNGLALLESSKGNYYKSTLNRREGIVRKDGKVIFVPAFNRIKNLDFPLVLIKENGKYGVYDIEKRKWVLPREYDSIKMDGEILSAQKNGENLLFFDLSGNLQNIPNYDLTTHYNKNLFGVRVGNKKGVVNLNGDLIIPIIYDSIQYLNANAFLVTKGNRWELFTGNNTIPIPYDNFNITKDGFLIVEKNGKKGLLNTNGQEVLPPAFQDFKVLYDGSYSEDNQIKGIIAFQWNEMWGLFKLPKY